MLWAGLIVAGLVIVGYSRGTLLAVAIVVMALTGAAVGAVNVVIAPLRRAARTVPEAGDEPPRPASG